MTMLHYVICKKIIQMRIYVPQWLLTSYKVCEKKYLLTVIKWYLKQILKVIFQYLQLRNAPELLKLLHSSGRLEEAIELAREYLLAALGYGKEFYGFEKPLVPSALPFCLPVYAIRDLIHELEIQNTKSLEKPYLRVSSFRVIRCRDNVRNEILGIR